MERRGFAGRGQGGEVARGRGPGGAPPAGGGLWVAFESENGVGDTVIDTDGELVEAGEPESEGFQNGFFPCPEAQKR